MIKTPAEYRKERAERRAERERLNRQFILRPPKGMTDYMIAKQEWVLWSFGSSMSAPLYSRGPFTLTATVNGKVKTLEAKANV